MSTNYRNNDPAPETGHKWTDRQIIYATLIVVAISLSFYLLFRFSQIVFILFIAIVISTAIRPVVNWLNRWGVSRSVGVLAVYLVILLVVAGLIALTAPLVSQQVASISKVVPTYYGELRSTLFLSQNLILQRIALNLPPRLALMPGEETSRPAAEVTAPEPVTPTPTAPQPAQPAPTPPPAGVLQAAETAAPPSLAGQVWRSLLGLAAIFVLGFFWTLERDRTVRNLLLWVSSARRESARELIQEVESKVGQFVLGQGVLCLAVGSLALTAYMIIGVPYALVLGIIAGITEAIPVFGPALGAAPAFIVALATDPSKALWVVAAAILIQTAENYILVPRVMKRSVGVNSLVLLLAFVAFSLLFGLGGAIVSVPLAAILQLLVDRYLLMPNLTEVQQTELGRDQISLYRLEAQTLAKDIRKQLVGEEEKDPNAEQAIDTLEAITTELDSLLAQFGQRESEA